MDSQQLSDSHPAEKAKTADTCTVLEKQSQKAGLVDLLQPIPSQLQIQPHEVHSFESYIDDFPYQQYVWQKPPVRPSFECVNSIDGERRMEIMRSQYKKELAFDAPLGNSTSPQDMKPLVSSELDFVKPVKSQLPVKHYSFYHLMAVNTGSGAIRKEAVHKSRVKSITPTLSSSTMKELTENIMKSIDQLDKEIGQFESQISKLKNELHKLEREASKSSVQNDDEKKVESKPMCFSQIIYSENKAKALESHAVLEKLGPKVEAPLYNQPSDMNVYHQNKQKYLMFKSKLIYFFKKRHREKELREMYLTDTYSELMQQWLRKVEEKENTAVKKAQHLKLREIFEEQFPILKKQRKDKERKLRADRRMQNGAKWEVISPGLQLQQLEEQKMHKYAVIPPICLDSRQRKLGFINHNGLVEDLSHEYLEIKMLHIWTDEENKIFREKYLQHPKNFSLIASFLNRKTVADCIQYYYLTKKTENYKQLLKMQTSQKRSKAFTKSQASQSSGITMKQPMEADTFVIDHSSASAANLNSKRAVQGTSSELSSNCISTLATSSGVTSASVQESTSSSSELLISSKNISPFANAARKRTKKSPSATPAVKRKRRKSHLSRKR